MKYKLHTTSKKTWDAMFRAIKYAKESIYIEMFIFNNDIKESHDFLGELKKKAQEGISVIVVLDSLGSKEFKKEIEKIKEKTKIEFLFFSHWFHHIHRKIIIVDEKISFIGGVNIGKKYTHWDDIQLEVRGKIITRKLLKSFAYTYLMSGGKNKEIIKHRKRKITSKLKFWLIDHWPAKNIYTLKKHYIEKISLAKKNIKIVTPYFNPPRWLISLLDSASKRGVEIEVFMPENSDIEIMNVLNYDYMNALYSLGIKFHLLKKMNHSKLLIIDDSEGLIGSQNLDFVSFQIDSEAGIFFKDEPLIKELLTAIENWKKNSFLFHPYYRKMKLIDYLIAFIMKFIRPIL